MPQLPKIILKMQQMARGTFSVKYSDISKLPQLCVPVSVSRHIGINYFNLLPKVIKIQMTALKISHFHLVIPVATGDNRKCIIQMQLQRF